MSSACELCPTTLTGLLRRIDAAAAALPACPGRALRELDAVRTELESRINVPPAIEPRHGHDVSLTSRERQVLHLLALGDRNKEIALRLGLRERTIKFHVANVLTKLGAHSRTEALRRALELRLVLPPPSDRP